MSVSLGLDFWLMHRIVRAHRVYVSRGGDSVVLITFG